MTRLSRTTETPRLLILAAVALALAGCASPPLHSAAADGDTVKLAEALVQGADINSTYQFWTPLMWAANKGNDEAVALLIKRGAEIDRTYGTPPSTALDITVKPGVARLLVDAGAKVHKERLDAVRDMSRDGVVLPELFEVLQEGYARQHGLPLPRTTSRRLPAATPATAPTTASETSSDVDTPRERGAERPDDFALVIGVEEYQSLPKADYGARDAEAVRRHLAALGVPERNIVALEGSQATKSKLEGYLQDWLPLNVKPDSTLFVYYSGHGAPDPTTGKAYLVPWDGDPMFLKRTGYPIERLYADLAKTKARRVVVALDACFSGAGGRSVLAKGARPLVTKIDEGVPAAANLTVLAAASGDQITGTLDGQGHGIFTYYFLKGLSGAAKDAAGAVTAKSLYEYLMPRVEDEARRQNRAQTPTLAGAGATLSAP